MLRSQWGRRLSVPQQTRRCAEQGSNELVSVLGQIREMLPARSLRIIAPTGGEQMQMRMVLAMAPMGVGHHNVAPPEGLAPDLTREIIQTLHPAAHQRAQHDRSIVIEGGAEHGWDRQENVAIHHPLSWSMVLTWLTPLSTVT